MLKYPHDYQRACTACGRSFRAGVFGVLHGIIYCKEFCARCSASARVCVSVHVCACFVSAVPALRGQRARIMLSGVRACARVSYTRTMKCNGRIYICSVRTLSRSASLNTASSLAAGCMWKWWGVHFERRRIGVVAVAPAHRAQHCLNISACSASECSERDVFAI